MVIGAATLYYPIDIPSKRNQQFRLILRTYSNSYSPTAFISLFANVRNVSRTTPGAAPPDHDHIHNPTPSDTVRARPETHTSTANAPWYRAAPCTVYPWCPFVSNVIQPNPNSASPYSADTLEPTIRTPRTARSGIEREGAYISELYFRRVQIPLEC